MSDEPQTAVDVVALALSQIFGRESVSEGMRFRARQIVGALEKSGHLPQHATP